MSSKNNFTRADACTTADGGNEMGENVSAPYSNIQYMAATNIDKGEYLFRVTPKTGKSYRRRSNR